MGVVLFLRDALIGQSGFQLNSDSFASTSLVLGWPVCTPHPVHVVLVLNLVAHKWSVSPSYATELYTPSLALLIMCTCAVGVLVCMCAWVWKSRVDT